MSIFSRYSNPYRQVTDDPRLFDIVNFSPRNDKKYKKRRARLASVVAPIEPRNYNSLADAVNDRRVRNKGLPQDMSLSLSAIPEGNSIFQDDSMSASGVSRPRNKLMNKSVSGNYSVIYDSLQDYIPRSKRNSGISRASAIELANSMRDESISDYKKLFSQRSNEGDRLQRGVFAHNMKPIHNILRNNNILLNDNILKQISYLTLGENKSQNRSISGNKDVSLEDLILLDNDTSQRFNSIMTNNNIVIPNDISKQIIEVLRNKIVSQDNDISRGNAFDSSRMLNGLSPINSTKNSRKNSIDFLQYEPDSPRTAQFNYSFDNYLMSDLPSSQIPIDPSIMKNYVPQGLSNYLHDRQIRDLKKRFGYENEVKENESKLEPYRKEITKIEKIPPLNNEAIAHYYRCLALVDILETKNDYLKDKIGRSLDKEQNPPINLKDYLKDKKLRSLSKQLNLYKEQQDNDKKIKDYELALRSEYPAPELYSKFNPNKHNRADKLEQGWYISNANNKLIRRNHYIDEILAKQPKKLKDIDKNLELFNK